MRLHVYILLISLAISLPVSSGEKNAIFHNKAGWDYLDKGDDFRAIISFKEALKMNPKYLDAIVGLGKAYLHTEAYDESLKLFNEALKVEKNNVEAVLGLGFAMTGLGRFNDALVYFDRALSVSEENLQAKYGIAYVYYLMDKNIWAERKLKTILKTNPYHYPSLLLMADIKIGTKRNQEAKQFIQKAVDSKPELPDGYIKYGMVHLADYRVTDNIEFLDEAMHEFKKALAIHPQNLSANRSMGYLSLLQNQYQEAVQYFDSALSAYPDNGTTIYNLALSHEKNKDMEKALNYYVSALKAAPSDSILQSKLEDFLVLNNYAVGHPLRIKFSDEHFTIALERQQANLSDEAILHLQRALLLNPMNKPSRENLRDYYFTHNYYRFYIDELKTLYKIYPENKYQDILNVAVIKRRDRLYQKAGYATELPLRDVPVVLVLNLLPGGTITPHPDAGEVIANYITFSLGQFGRMDTVGVKKRLEISASVGPGKYDLGDTLEKLADEIREKRVEKIDFIVFGNFRETSNHISVNCELLDFHTGVIISNFTISENGKENIPKISMRVSKRLYDSIPFSGRILKAGTGNIIINLGLIDGIKPGDLLEITKLKSPEKDEKSKIDIREKLIFVVNESDTLISSAKPLKSTDFQLVDINDKVYPLKKRRSKMIE